MAKFVLSNKTQNKRYQCKVVVYNWVNKAPLEAQLTDSQLAESTRLEISSQVISASYSKNMSMPCGNFSITLSNSPGFGSNDWKDIIKRGQWLVMYMSDDGSLNINPQVGVPSTTNRLEENKLIRCIGFIDRVAPSITLNEQGAFDATYQITGRDFGVVYEDTVIWHNLFQFDQILLESLIQTKLNITGLAKVHEVLKLVHDLFYNPKAIDGVKAKVNNLNSLTTIALQWLLPKQLCQDVFGTIGSNGSTYWGEMPGILNIKETEAGLAVEKPTDYLTGGAWDQLKRISVSQFHELYTEVNDLGIPQLNFRPIPFAINKSAYPIVGKLVSFYKDIPSIKISAENVVTFNLAEDNHGRYNSFLTTVSTSLINTEDNISILKGTKFPYFEQNSIKRYGFRPMHVTVDSIIKNAQADGGKSDRRILIEYNELLKDYWENYVFTDSGTAEHTGRNDIKVGKCLVYDTDVPYIATRRYYVEGYIDSYTVNELGVSTWSQSIQLTRGIEEQDLINGFADQRRDTPFVNAGEYTPQGLTNSKGKK